MSRNQSAKKKPVSAYQTRAWVWQTGLIEFGSGDVPEGAIVIACGPDKELRDFINGVSRHGYATQIVNGRRIKVVGSEHLLVPSLPEALAMGKYPLSVLRQFCNRIKTSAPAGVTVL